MSDRLDAGREPRRYRRWLFLAAPLVIALLVLLFVLKGNPRPLKPVRTPSSAVTPLNEQPLMLAFGDLDQDPGGWLDQRLRLTGEYRPADIANCAVPRGPKIRWRLLADDLALNAVGYETVLRLIPAGTVLTVDGIWRQYAGRVGCGKNAPEDTLWYLEVERIVQPNPLYAAGPGSGETVPGSVPLPPLGLEGTPVPPEATIVATPEVGETSTVAPGTPATTPGTTASPGATAPPGTGTPTPAAGSPTATPTGPSRTPGPTATAGPTNPPGTASPSPSATPSMTPLPGIPTNTPFPTPPPLLTATPGEGYPGPPSDSTPTATSEPYP